MVQYRDIIFCMVYCLSWTSSNPYFKFCMKKKQVKRGPPPHKKANTLFTLSFKFLQQLLHLLRAHTRTHPHSDKPSHWCTLEQKKNLTHTRPNVALAITLWLLSFSYPFSSTFFFACMLFIVNLASSVRARSFVAVYRQGLFSRVTVIN